MLKDNVLVVFDPGPHCGVAIFENGNLAETLLVEATDDSLELRRQYIRLDTILRNIANVNVGKRFVVIEDYRSQMMLSLEGYATVQMVGFLRWTARLLNLDVYLQLPAVRRAFLDRVAQFKFNTPLSRHERDAVAQGFAWLETHKEDWEHA